MRLGGPVFCAFDEPTQWAGAVRSLGYGAAVCPIDELADDATVAAYVAAARAENVVIAEVGAWSNPLSSDAETRAAAVTFCQRRLDLAERIGARCCVNIAGSRGERWDGPHPDNLSPATFDLIVQTTREIVDAVRPTRTFYTLEAMPWVFPDGPESYLALLKAIDRPGVGVHLDPVNMISSPQRYYDTGAFIRSCFELLGPYIKNCHAKDIRLGDTLTVHLDEVRPGLGALDYHVYLTQLAKLERETSLMLEHLPSPEEYAQGAAYLRSVAAECGLSFEP